MAITSHPEKPYFDDINTQDIDGLTPLDKNYLRILFRPGTSIQTRELNQIQSLLQSQVDRLGQSLFKSNSPLIGAECTFQSDLYYLTCTLSQNDIVTFNSITPNINELLLSQDDNIDASVTKIESLSEDGSVQRIYFQYKSGNTEFNTASNIAIRRLSEETNEISLSIFVSDSGKAVGVSLEDGLYFTKGCVVSAKKQYTATPLNNGTTKFSGFVALRVEENEISAEGNEIAANNDKSLFDNANGSFNFASRGADRYQIVLTPVLIQDSKLPENDGFEYIQVLKISDSLIIQVQNTIDASGSNLEKILALRTYEESGDYIVNEFLINNQEVYGQTYASRYSIEEDLAQFNITAQDSDSKFVTTISPGIAYVSGSRVENLADNTIIANKARTTYSELNNSSYLDSGITADLGSYVEGVYATNSGAPVLDIDAVYNLVEVISNTTANIGTCKIQSCENVNSAITRLYLYDINITTTGKTFKDVTHIRENYNGYGSLDFSISLSSNAGESKLNDVSTDSSLFSWPYGFIKGVRDIRVTEKQYFAGIVTESGQVTFTTNSDDVFDKSPLSITIWTGTTPVVHSIPINGAPDWSIVSGQPGNTLTINMPPGKNTLGLAVRILASVATDITTKRGVKELTTEALSSFKNENGSPTNNESAISAGTILTLTGVYHAISVNDSRFSLHHDGQYPNRYAEAKIIANTNISAGSLATVNVTHWKFKSSGNTNTPLYYTADSYIKPGQTEPVDLSLMPLYRGFRLSDYLDARTLPNSDDRLVLDPYSPITAQLDLYLGRKDLLIVDNNGEFKFIEGTPSLIPDFPNTIDKSMILYEYTISPYTFTVKDISTKKINHRRYTMRDIDSIEKRVGALEYYTSLSLLEKNASEKAVFGADGTERFKNGFITDSFRNFGTVNLTNPQFRSTFDRENGKLYPFKQDYAVKFSPINRNQSGIKFHKSSAMLDYNIIEADEFTQPLATQFISLQPHDNVPSIGVLQLYPEVDTWSDRVTTPPVSIELFPGLDDTIQAIAENIPGFLGLDLNNWQTVSKKTVTTKAKTRAEARRNPGGKWATDTTTTNQVRSGTQTSLVTENINSSLGRFVSDVNVRPYMRSRSIRLRAAGLKANSTYYFFFNGINVTNYVRPVPTIGGVIPSISDFNIDDDEGVDESTLLAKYPAGAITSNNDGVVEAIFIVPNNNSLKFASGDGTLRITNSVRNLLDETFSKADARFISNGLGITTGETIASTQVPRIQVTPVTQERTIITKRYHDPVAQTFITPGFNGMFISGIEVYFASKPQSNRATVRAYLVRTSNGYPTSNIIPGSEVVLDIDSVNVSNDSSLGTEFNFETPLYINGEYAVVIFSESPEYTVYIAELDSDKVDLLTGQPINKQPSFGVFFTSSNKTTWSAWQNRDLKLKIRRANFTSQESIIRFNAVISSAIQKIEGTIPNNTGWGVNTTISISAPTTPGGITAQASAIFDPNTRAITGFNITRAGSGYTSSPTVIIIDNENNKSENLSASLFGYPVSSFMLNMKSLLYNTTDISSLSQTTGISNSIISKVKLGNITYNVNPLQPIEKLLQKNYVINSSSENETIIEITLRSNTNYFSPVIDLDSLSLEVRSHDLVNSKYFTKEVNLANPADRLDLYLDVNRPTTTSNIKVYGQFKNTNGSIIGSEYQLLNPIQPTVIPITTQENVYNEVKYNIEPDGEFSSFTIKIEFEGVDSTDICTVKDLRAIATI